MSLKRETEGLDMAVTQDPYCIVKTLPSRVKPGKGSSKIRTISVQRQIKMVPLSVN